MQRAPMFGVPLLMPIPFDMNEQLRRGNNMGIFGSHTRPISKSGAGPIATTVLFGYLLINAHRLRFDL